MTLGVQLYTVRDHLGECTSATLGKLAKIGFKELELFHQDVAELATLASVHGLRTVSTHVPMTSLVSGEAGTVRRHDVLAMFENLRRHAIDLVGTYLPFNACRPDADFWNETADILSEIGSLAKKVGLRFFYHNHAVELTELPRGGVPLDLLLQQTEPGTVSFELDIFWASAAGADPVAVLERLGNRIALLHLKDKASGAPAVVDDTTMPGDAFAAIGEGTLAIDAILRVAQALEIRHVFVEQDYATDPLASLSRSVNCIRKLTGQDIPMSPLKLPQSKI